MDLKQKQCDCTDKCLGYLTKTCTRKEPKQDWFCPKCDSYVSSESVTFEETHQTCNTGVVIKEPKQEIVKDLAYWKANAEEDYMKVPISVLRYISELENQMYSEEDIDKQIQDFKHDLLESTSDSIKQLCSGAILGLNRLKQFKKK